MTWEADIKTFADKTKTDLDTTIRNVVKGIAKIIDQRSPVADSDYWKKQPKEHIIGGHYRMNNQYQFGSPATDEIVGQDPTGSISLRAIEEAVDAAPAAGVHYLSNNVPYARRIEDGWSNQAPKGVYELAIIDAEAIIRNENRKK